MKKPFFIVVILGIVTYCIYLFTRDNEDNYTEVATPPEEENALDILERIRLSYGN